ncbi:hypothetical protein [Halolamina salina]|uniref:Uncharacterized protein n=1 Tax=Halolamina salina TaxID=1220023 RepID=A0ABD6B895_9EURY
MSKRDGGLALGIGGVFAAGADLLINGGGALMLALDFFLNQSGLIYMVTARLAAAAPNVAWLPVGLFSSLSTAIALVTAVYGLYRIAKNLNERRNSNS